MNESHTTGKPISLMREDFIQQLSGLINTSGLPMIIIEPIIENILRQISVINQQQLEQDRAEWESIQASDGDESNI